MKLVFLDRDGVINKFPGIGHYVTRKEEFHLFPGALEAIALLSRFGYEVNVITNQGCIGHGYITVENLEALHDSLKDEVQKRGGKIDGIYYCPHRMIDNCECKKPKVELFKKAAQGREIVWSDAYFVGDSEDDIAAGKTIGCRTILVLSGRSQESDISNFKSKPDHVVADLLEAAQWLLKRS